MLTEYQQYNGNYIINLGAPRNETNSIYHRWNLVLHFTKPANHLLSAVFQVVINLLKPTGHVMHQQFNIQQLYVLPTLYLRVLYLFENKQRLVPLTA